jgi:hypothetical protein
VVNFTCRGGERLGQILCLLEAPNNEPAIAVDRDARGVLPDESIKVKARS